MKVICTDKGNTNNITVGKEYILEKEENNYYHILNDNNEMKRYNKKLFKLEKELMKYYDSSKLNINSNVIKYENINLSFGDIDNYSSHESYISCGISEITNLNEGIFDNILNLINKCFLKLKELKIISVDKEHLVSSIFNYYFEEILTKECRNGFTLISTNITNNPYIDEFKKYNFDVVSYIDGFSTGSFITINNNTKNEICLWIFQADEL